MTDVTLYGKPGCHLCEEARMLLARLEQRYDITVQEIDITSDPTLFRRFDIVIPVIVVDGKGEFQAPIDARSITRAIANRQGWRQRLESWRRRQ